MKPATVDRQPLSDVLAELIVDWEQIFAHFQTGGAAPPPGWLARAPVHPSVEPAEHARVAMLARFRAIEARLRERELEFSLARRVWRALLPDAAPVLPGFQIGGATFPVQDTGGDFLDFLELADGSLGIAIGDASGHGMGAALLITQLCVCLRALALSERTVGRILALANRRLAADVPEGFFASLLLAQLDAATGTLVYSSAGHPPGYLLDARGEVRVVLHSTGMILGIQSHGAFPTAPTLTIEPGEMVLFLTDGILEASPPGGQPFGAERALALVREMRHGHPDAIVRALVSDVQAHVNDHVHDDMTAIVVKAIPGFGPDVPS